MTLTFLKNLGQLFFRGLSNWVLSDAPSWLESDYAVLAGILNKWLMFLELNRRHDLT